MTMRIRLGLAAALGVAVGMIWGAAAGVPDVATAQETGSISGVAIDDENGNAVIEAGEPGLAGWEVAITSAVEAVTAQVAADGSYIFEGLRPGTYTVRLVKVVGGAAPPPPWIPTLPNADLSYDVALAAGEDIENMNFAIQLLDEAAVFFANIMVDAAPASEGTVVQALIGDTVCDEYTVGVGPSVRRFGLAVIVPASPNRISVVVPSANEKEGCGSEGDTITFTIDGRPANEAVPWYSGDQGATTLTTGPLYASYLGIVRVGAQEVHGTAVKAYIGETLCGEAEGLMGTYGVIVPPAELRAGCGEEGATVRFTIGEEEAEQIAQWAVGRHELDLTAPVPKPSPTPSPSPSPTPSPVATPAEIPEVGGGGTASSDSDAGWWPIALAAAAALALSGGGFLVWAGRRGRRAR